MLVYLFPLLKRMREGRVIYNNSMLLCVLVLTPNKIILDLANFMYNIVSFDNVHISDFLIEIY